jgi:phosphatidylinositol-3-phosphatase
MGWKSRLGLSVRSFSLSCFSLWILSLVLVACQSVQVQTPGSTATAAIAQSATPVPGASATIVPAATETPTLVATETQAASATPRPAVPNFKYIVVILMENKEFETAMNSRAMPSFTGWARKYTLLSQEYAITHPSLPNYMALFSGETYYTSDIPDGPVSGANLADLVEASGRTWKDYQENMPAPCGLEDTRRYVQKHNPFVWFESVRNDPERCKRSVVPLTDLDTDLANQSLPNFSFIMPNLCNSAHDCDLDVTDAWLEGWVSRLMAYPGMLEDGLIVLTWDEGQGTHGCCGYDPAGGRVATVLISNQVRAGFEDKTPYTHYSLLKMMETAWNLQLLGHSGDANTTLIEAPFQ